MNEVDEAESRSARHVCDDPCGPRIRTRAVISSVREILLGTVVAGWLEFDLVQVVQELNLASCH